MKCRVAPLGSRPGPAVALLTPGRTKDAPLMDAMRGPVSHSAARAAGVVAAVGPRVPEIVIATPDIQPLSARPPFRARVLLLPRYITRGESCMQRTSLRT